jgi:parvulin-like peptidyl-prolyl isomerase
MRFLWFAPICLFLLVGCAQKEEIVAKVGDSNISSAKYRRVLNRKMQLLGKVDLPVEEKKALVNELIDRKLLYREGVRLGIQPAGIELNAAEARARNSFDNDAAFVASLQREGLDKEGFRKEATEELVVKQVEDRLASGVVANEAEARRYYDLHNSDYKIPLMYKIYLVQAKDEDDAGRLFKELHRDVAAFDRLALNQGSPELRTINKKAELTPKSDFPDQMFPALEMLKPGEIGGPVKTKNGYFLFRLLDRREGSQKSWNEVKGEISHLLFQENRQKAIDGWLAQQKSGLKIEIFANRL